MRLSRRRRCMAEPTRSSSQFPQDRNSDDVCGSGRSGKFPSRDHAEDQAIYAETIGNPRINVLDIEAVAKIAHEAGILPW